jgi:hypothetical protein
MQGFIIVWCGYEGIEKIVGLFTEEEAVERMTRFRKAEFKTTHYHPLPEDWDILDKTEKDCENEKHFQTMGEWTAEDNLQDKFDSELRYARRDGRTPITREDFPNMSEEEFEHQVYLRSTERRIKEFTDRFCVMEIGATGATCACTKLGVPASEYVIY